MAKDSEIANALRSTLISPNVVDSNLENANVVDVLDNMARNLGAIGKQLQMLGTGNADTRGKGAIECLAMEVEKGCGEIASAGQAIADSINSLAAAIEKYHNQGESHANQD